MKTIYKIDENGHLLFGEEIQIKKNEEVHIGYIDIPLPRDNKGNQLPIHKPKWTGTEWIEGLTQAEIDELNKQPIKEPSEIDLLKQEKEILAQSVYDLTTIVELILTGGITE